MRKSSVIVFLLPLIGAACTPKRVAVTPYPDTSSAEYKAVPEGVPVRLPRLVLKVDVVYSVPLVTTQHHGVKSGAPEKQQPTIVKPIVVTPVRVPDPAGLFLLSAREPGESFLADSNLDLTLSDGLVLDAASAEYVDRSAEVLSSFVSSGVKVAGLFAGFAPAGDPELQPIVTRIGHIYEEAGTLAAATDPKKLEKLTALKDELEVAVAELKKKAGTQAP